MSKTAIMHFDGACEPTNPGGWGLYGYAILLHGAVVASGKGNLGRSRKSEPMTNNVAEYAALIYGTIRLADLLLDGIIAPDSVEIRGDSKLVVEQVNGRWRCKSPVMMQACQAAIASLKRLPVKWKLVWVPREQNEIADTLTREAYAEVAA